MKFEPIAIVGQSCLLPGARDPEALWDAVRTGRDLIGAVRPGRWGVGRSIILGDAPEKAWSDRGGYVEGFDALFDRSGFAIPASEVALLDPLFQWVLHTAREALRSARVHDTSRTGAIFGNLSFPSEAMTSFATRVWLGQDLADAAGVPTVDARNRFTSGLPAHVLAKALRLGDISYAIDAACASSLYAIKLACDRLHDRSADVMLAGAVNRADDLFIHVGFTSLQALSRSGRSRPFHREADGLVPAEGAGFVVLKRLADAESAGDPIHGVIRAVGLSNDGRGSGFLAPSAEGQERAMRAAYGESELSPERVSLVECHATGTVLGDTTELQSMGRIFDGRSGVPIGSLKSNLGHSITVAGVAGLIKVMAAMKAGIRPPTLHADAPLEALSGSPFRLLREEEPWNVDGPRTAAVNAFGFGGNNAHLIVEEHTPARTSVTASPSPPRPKIAIVGLGARVGDGRSRAEFAARLFGAASGARTAESVELSLEGLSFPPRDLDETLPQQTMVLAACHEALAGLETFPRERTGAVVGMGCDPNVARFGARWRLDEWAPKWDAADPGWIESAKAGVVHQLGAAGVLGTMPNIVTNRLNRQFGFAGPSLSISAEELSGLRALQLATRALEAGDWDTAVVGAVDMSSDPVHQRALEALGRSRPTGDAAVVLVLKRLDDAREAGDPVLALVDASDAQQAEPFDADTVTARFGEAHSAVGLVRVAAAALSCARDRRPGDRIRVHVDGMEGVSESVDVVAVEGANGETFMKSPETPDGPTAHYPGHWPPVAVPPTPKASPAIHVMEPAPMLVPVLEPAPTPMPAPAPAAIAVAAPVRAPASPAPTAAPGAPSHTMAFDGTPSHTMAFDGAPSHTMAAHYAGLTEIHRRYIEQQASVHQRFLELRAHALQTLTGQGNGRETPLPHLAAAPTPPASVAPPPEPIALAPSAPAPALPAQADPQPTVLPGPKLDRRQLEILASGKISEIFGPMFQQQDEYTRQVRMPMPPLLLADRVLGIDAEMGAMKLGTIWTETDVVDGAWYLHDDRMPTGIMVESGQADLLLISYLGVDFVNRGERAYRLLGCELTFHDTPPTIGDTLHYEIHIDRHARQGDVRLFFFHYDCKVGDQLKLSVREGQAGFFTDQEMADSDGVLWDAETGERCDSPRLDPPRVQCTRNRFSRDDLEAFAAGRVLDCFGPGFELSEPHTRTPRLPGGRMLLFDEVTELDTSGGPWGRGYLRAVDPIEPDDWFFPGHFKNDPCMPGTLMFEGCLQTMAFYLTAMGYTLDKDGYRFEPVPEESALLRCRGQVTPESRELIYEVFVEEVIDGPQPTLYADLLCTVDGLKAFHCRRMALRLAPAWPIEQRPGYVKRDDGRPAATVDGFRFDYDSLLACALGPPSQAFGPRFRPLDGPRRVPRLPGPPYHFMSRVTDIDGEMGAFKAGIVAEFEYDVPPDAWYFDDNKYPIMPYCVLLEAALQPCGWLATFVGSTLQSEQDLFFRNLDGTGTVFAEVGPDAGTLRTRVESTNISRAGGVLIESFDVTCYVGEQKVYEMQTVFGFFPKESLENQAGLPADDAFATALADTSDVSIDLTSSPERYFAGTACLPEPSLLIIDRVTGYWPDGGSAGLGRLRTEKDVEPSHWSFKAHFFQDPVQPGSLGIEAMLQALKAAMLAKGLDAGIAAPRFEAIALSEPLTWKYRGQVTVGTDVVTTVVDITDVGERDGGTYAIAKASLWVDSTRIYEASNLGMRIVPGSKPTTETLDPAKDTWLRDHCPTWTVPALPMMSMLDRIAGAAASPGRHVVGLTDVSVKRWLVLPGATHLETEVMDSSVVLRSDGEPVAEGKVTLGTTWPEAPEPFAPLEDATPVADPYESAALFHGPAFHVLRSLSVGSTGSSAVLDAGAGGVPFGHSNQLLLDGATHGIPHDALSQWSDEIGDDQVAYPVRITDMTIHGPAPTRGEVRVEVRFDGLLAKGAFPTFRVQLIQDGEVWAAFRLMEALFPKGPIGRAAPTARRDFLRDRRFVEGVSLSTPAADGDSSRLDHDDVAQSDWLPGTIEAVYGTREPERIAVKEHLSRKLALHPRHLPEALPLNHFPVDVVSRANETIVRDDGPERLDMSSARKYWSEWFDIGPWPVEDLYFALINRFVRRVVVTDPDRFRSLEGRSILYLCNHQVGIESLLFSVLTGAMTRVPTVTLAKIEHRTSWLGQLITHCFTYPGVDDPGTIRYFDRSDKASLPTVLAQLAGEMKGKGRSVSIHVEGTRSLSCRQPVERMSGAVIDLALATGSPVVPARFVGGLPAEPLERRIEFPVGMGTQDYWLGAPMLPEELGALDYGERKRRVLNAINELGPDASREAPNPPDPAFAASVDAWARETGAAPEHAVLMKVLSETPDICEPTRRLLEGAPSESASELDQWLSGLAGWLFGNRDRA